MSFFRLRVDDFTQESLIKKMYENVKRGSSRVVYANHNLHSLYLGLKDESFSTWINSQDIVHADGMGIVYLSKLFGKKLNRANRITYVDLMPDILKLAMVNDYKIFYLGATQESLDKGLSKIQSLYPSLNIVGCNGFNLNDAVEKINFIKPDILFVGMGMPFQELWIKNNIKNLICKVILPCGAIMDYYSGIKKTPPRWAGKLGLEWLFRLSYEPKRLWKRYLLEPLYIFYILLIDLLKK